MAGMLLSGARYAKPYAGRRIKKPPEQERKRAPGAGRKPLAAETVVVKVRVTAAQYEKLKQLPNASAWLRGQIDQRL